MIGGKNGTGFVIAVGANPGVPNLDEEVRRFEYKVEAGAEVAITTALGPQYATVSTAGSYLSASDKRVHFGLGKETTVQKIEIRWPSGLRQTLKDVYADQILQIDEPAIPSPAVERR